MMDYDIQKIYYIGDDSNMNKSRQGLPTFLFFIKVFKTIFFTYFYLIFTIMTRYTK